MYIHERFYLLNLDEINNEYERRKYEFITLQNYLKIFRITQVVCEAFLFFLAFSWADQARVKPCSSLAFGIIMYKHLICFALKNL